MREGVMSGKNSTDRDRMFGDEWRVQKTGEICVESRAV